MQCPLELAVSDITAGAERPTPQIPRSKSVEPPISWRICSLSLDSSRIFSRCIRIIAVSGRMRVDLQDRDAPPVAKDLVRFADSRERVVSAFDRPYRDIACRTVRAKPVVLALA